MSQNNDYLKWKERKLMQCNDIISNCDISNIISKKIEFVNSEIAKGRIKSLPYYGKRIVAKEWLSEYLDSIQEYFDPSTETFVFSKRRPIYASDGSTKNVCSVFLEKRKRNSVCYEDYSSFEELLEDFEDELTVHDIAHILGQNSETIRYHMLKGRIKYRKEGVVYIVEKPWLLDYLREKGITYESRLQGRDKKRNDRFDAVVEFCRQPRTIYEIMEFTGVACKHTARVYLLTPLIEQGRLRFTCKHPHDNRQKYIAL